MKLKAALIAASALIAGAAVAGDNGFYAGAGAGWSQMSLPRSDITNEIAYIFGALDAPLTAWSDKTDDSDIMWSAFVGYRIMKYVAVEAGYMDTGNASYTGSGLADITVITDPGPPPVSEVVSVPTKASLDWGASGWQASVLGIWPINDSWEVFGRVGGFFADVNGDVRVTVDTGAGKSHYSESSSEFLYGVGVDGKFMENWAARFEWLAIPSLGNSSTGEADWNGLQFSLLYRF
jgi:OmpA-OmpF porin, OOP family